jgi:hypothetical protein
MAWHSSSWLLRKLMQSKGGGEGDNTDAGDDNDETAAEKTVAGTQVDETADDADNDMTSLAAATGEDDLDTATRLSNFEKGKEQLENINNTINDISQKMNGKALLFDCQFILNARA